LSFGLSRCQRQSLLPGILASREPSEDKQILRLSKTQDADPLRAGGGKARSVAVHAASQVHVRPAKNCIIGPGGAKIMGHEFHQFVGFFIYSISPFDFREGDCVSPGNPPLDLDRS
jgi:hypothetical protein